MGLKALILVGGYGTRLRPLTLTRPKPLVEFCNKPILFHQIEALIEAGVDTVVLAVSYMCEMLEEKINKLVDSKKIQIIYSKEEEPLGTGGPLALARTHLNGPDPFIVLNSDITCIFPFSSMLAYHRSKNAEGTIAVTRVEEPSKYGVVVSDDDGRVLNFFEKPSIFISNKINAGIYILNPSVLERIKVSPLIFNSASTNIYREGGFWMDIGQPKDYLMGSKMYLAHMEHLFPEKLGYTSTHPFTSYEHGLIHPSAVIGKNCHIGKDVVIGENVVIEDGVCLTNCVILSETRIKSYCYIDKSLIAWRCTIGKWVKII
ncbi:hypothetical protein HZS_5085 [Henneguya salminicola]|nr:hypothetical protein HZS_5085 [Henneguya salminicola]